MVALPQEGGEPIRDNGRRVPSPECGDQGCSASGLPHSNNQERRELNFKSDSLTEKTTPVVINPHIIPDYPDGDDVEPTQTMNMFSSVAMFKADQLPLTSGW